MHRRHCCTFALPALAAILVAAAAVSTACGGGEAYGERVTVYTDGDTYRYDTDKAYCESTCAERMAESDLISSCYFAGSLASPLEP